MDNDKIYRPVINPKFGEVTYSERCPVFCQERSGCSGCEIYRRRNR